MNPQRHERPVNRASAWPGVDEVALALTVVLLCSLSFLLGEQTTSMSVTPDQMGLTVPQGNAFKQAILAPIYAGFALLLVTRTRPSEWAAIGVPLVLLLLLCFASVAWSAMPSVSVRRSVAFAGTMVLGTYAALRLDEHQVSRVMLACGWVVLLGSFALAALLPASGFDPEGRLRGVFAHKNGMGVFSALILMLALVCLPNARPGRSRLLVALLAFPCSIALVLSGSLTPTLAMLFGVAMVIVQARRGTRTCVVLLLAALAAGLLAPLLASSFGEVALLFGRDADFSGRTFVWLFSLEFVERSPLLGYGYNAFWVSPAAVIFQRWSGFPVPHGHNGYLDLALGVGVPGAALAVAAFLRVIRAVASVRRTSAANNPAFTTGIVAFLLVMNIGESAFGGNGFETVLFVYLVVRANMVAQGRIGQDDMPRTPALEDELPSSGVLR